LLLRLARVLCPGSFGSALVQRCRLEPSCNDECSDWLVQPLLGTSQDWKSDGVRQARRFSQSSRCLRRALQLLYREIEEDLRPCQYPDNSRSALLDHLSRPTLHHRPSRGSCGGRRFGSSCYPTG